MALLDSKSCGVSHQALIGGACTWFGVYLFVCRRHRATSSAIERTAERLKSRTMECRLGLGPWDPQWAIDWDDDHLVVEECREVYCDLWVMLTSQFSCPALVINGQKPSFHAAIRRKIQIQSLSGCIYIYILGFCLTLFPFA
jgi:hypothetical protein